MTIRSTGQTTQVQLTPTHQATVTLEYPRNAEEGGFLERLAMFAARGDRSVKSRDELWDEVNSATPEKRAHFLNQVIKQDWALDVAELNFFGWHIEGIPTWLCTEWFRHRLIVRDWSFQALSKRAIQAHRFEVINPFEPDTLACKEFDELAIHSLVLLEQWTKMGIPAEKIRYAALEGTATRMTAGCNARALHHFVTMRGSAEVGGNGRAAPEFLAITDAMYRQAKAVCPNLFATLLRS